MPELLGDRIKDGKLLAVVHYPNARRFTLMPKGAAQPARTRELEDHKGDQK